MPLQVRRGPTADRLSIVPVIGEVVYDTTEQSLYIGDGVTPGGVAASSFTFEDAQDAAASLFTSGIHSNISFSYNDAAGRIDASINLNNYSGAIAADAFQGSVYSDNSTLLLDGVLAAVNLDGTVRSDIIPAVNEAFDIGSPTSKFKDLYLSGSSLWIGDAQITALGSAINLPAGSTVDGVSIGSGGGTGDGVVEGSNYRINIIGEDSSLIVDADTGSVTAPGGIVGDLRGSVFGNDSSVIIDSNNNSIIANGGIVGNLTGTVFGNVQGAVTGSLTGTVFGNDNTVLINSFDNSIAAPGGIVGNLTGSVFGDDGLIVDVDNNSVNASGGIFGDLVGSVFGQDSTVLVDAVNSQIRGDFVGKLGNDLNTNNFAIINDNNVFIVPANFTQFGSTVFNRNGNIVIRRPSYTGGILDGLGGLLFEQFHDNSLSDRMVFHRSRGTYTAPTPLQTGDRLAEIAFVGNTNQLPFSGISSSIRVVATSGPVSSIVPSRIEFRCSSTSTDPTPLVVAITPDKKLLVDRIESLRESLTVVGDLIGSVFSDDSTRIIDGTDGSITAGSITAGSFVQFGSLTTAERDALSAVNGMVIYNTTNNRFEGRQNGVWINLDDGTAAGA